MRNGDCLFRGRPSVVIALVVSVVVTVVALVLVTVVVAQLFAC